MFALRHYGLSFGDDLTSGSPPTCELLSAAILDFHFRNPRWTYIAGRCSNDIRGLSLYSRHVVLPWQDRKGGNQVQRALGGY